MSLPIIPILINKSFVDFLSIADTLQSFREYLSNAIMTTEKMSKIEKYPIASTEIGSKLDAHISPIMDEGFNRKFTEDKAPKKDVTIQFLYLGDLLGQERGQEMMEVLSNKKFLSMMSIPYIKYLVLF